MAACCCARARPTARRDVAEVVEWFGAMQAQDLASGLWSLGARLPGCTRRRRAGALERREALRTWPMRGTVHLVPSRDAHWMLELMGVRALAGAATRRAALGLTEADADRAVDVLGAALAGGGRLTRAQCLRHADRGRHRQRRPARLPPALVREPARRHLHGAARRHRTDLRAARRVGARAAPAGTRRGAGDHRAALLPRPRPDHPAGVRRLDRAHRRRRPARHRRGRRRADDGTGRRRTRCSWTRRCWTRRRRRAPGDDLLALPGFDEYLLGFKDRALMLDPRTSRRHARRQRRLPVHRRPRGWWADWNGAVGPEQTTTRVNPSATLPAASGPGSRRHSSGTGVRRQPLRIDGADAVRRFLIGPVVGKAVPEDQAEATCSDGKAGGSAAVAAGRCTGSLLYAADEGDIRRAPSRPRPSPRSG